MANTIASKTEVAPMERVEVRYVHRKALFGLLEWDEVAKETTLGRDLVIKTTEEPERIFLNGREINRSEEDLSTMDNFKLLSTLIREANKRNMQILAVHAPDFFGGMSLWNQTSRMIGVDLYCTPQYYSANQKHLDHHNEKKDGAGA